MARKRRWSYNAGERGRNWVRAYCKGCESPCARKDQHTGDLYLEWREVLADEHGQPILDSRTGTPRVRRPSVLLKGVRDIEEAKRRADKLAAEFATLSPADGASLTTAQLLTRYLKEATPRKGESKQGHDRRAARVWYAFFKAQPEAERQVNRHPRTLDRLDWERFAEDRREGRIPGWRRRVRNKVIQDDLAFLVAVLNWAVGVTLLSSNPWDGAIRSAQHWPRVRELNPHRPAMVDWVRQGLIRHAPSWQMELAFVLEREQRRRNNAVRQLRWSDLDLEAQTVSWRAEHDKRGRGNVTPLTAVAAAALRKAPSRGIGETPVFPAAEDPNQPTPRDTFQIWLRRAKRSWLEAIDDAAERERVAAALRGVGYHAEKRAGVRDPAFRQLPAAIQEEIAGTNYPTLRRIYDHVTVNDMREAWPEAKPTAGNG